MRKKLGLIAGGGQFPLKVCDSALKQGYLTVGVGFKDYTDPLLASRVDEFLWVNLGQLGKVIKFLKKNHVQEVIFAGPISKPKALNLRPDFRAAKVLFKLKSLNDGAIFKALIAEFESEGFRVVGPQQFVPDLIAPSGILSFRKPSSIELESFKFGWPILKKIGNLDIGQCLVVKEKIVIAVEGIEGTNATIKRAGELAGKGCVVLKAFKPGQDERIDMPALGLETIKTMIEAKATALFFEAKYSLFFDLDKSLKLANEHGLTIVGIKEGKI